MLLVKSCVSRNKHFRVLLSFLFLTILIPHCAFSHEFCTGICCTSLFPLREASQYFKNEIGGGVCAEFTLTDEFGFSFLVQYAKVIPSESHIISAWQSTQLIGFYYCIPLKESEIFFQPSVECGLVQQGARINKEYGSLPQNVYIDPLIQLCPSFVFHSEKLIDSIKFEISPALNFIPQKSGCLLSAGVRLGILYTFDLSSGAKNGK